jgi:LmbE family N-acetylglucosaminyl deacetylase
MKIAVLSAHRGDAALACGLGVDAWLNAGHHVEVIACFTRSEFAPFSDANSLHANDRMSFVTATRKREDEAWVKRYPPAPGRGRLTLTDLNLKDAPLRLHIGQDEVFGLEVNAAEKSSYRIQKALERSSADALVLPLAIDGHIDRLTARTAALAGREALPVAFYEDQPQASAMGGEELVARAVASLGALPLASAFAGQPLDEDGVEAAVTRKRRLAWCYDSQIDEATTERIAASCRLHGGREQLWVNAVWAASELAITS